MPCGLASGSVRAMNPRACNATAGVLRSRIMDTAIASNFKRRQHDALSAGKSNPAALHLTDLNLDHSGGVQREPGAHQTRLLLLRSAMMVG